ncbi:uncharacterized protein [Anoplolepis gracilipes]|uniref:uncharacterized protein n=1 Tax=Anoplolepis gracilipes TaxID=354296 RepID=UPI003BA3A80B
MAQHMLEAKIGVCAVSELRHVPDSQFWLASENGLAAIHWKPELTSTPCMLVKKCKDFVVAKCEDFHIVSCYILSNTTSVGSTTSNSRGHLVKAWAAECDLQLINVGSTPTCVRPQGSSVVDFTWASYSLAGMTAGIAASYIRDWKVLQETETYLITVTSRLKLISPRKTAKTHKNAFPRWNWRRMDIDKFIVSLEWSCCDGSQLEGDTINAKGREGWLRKTMRDACDSAAPRIKNGNPKRSAYWWNSTITHPRQKCCRAKRLWSKNKRRQNTDERESCARNYKLARNAFRLEIKKAKSAAWQKLLQTIEQDPWGFFARWSLTDCAGPLLALQRP